MFNKFLEQTNNVVSLNEVQQQAAAHTDGPMLLLASPGSGKTTTMIMRIAYLVQYGKVPSNRIIAVSFSKASAHDMAERYRKLFPSLPRVAFSTIHSLAFEIVRNVLSKQAISYHVIDGYQAESAETHVEEMVDKPFVTKHRLLTDIFLSINGTLPKEEQMDELTRYISYVKNKMLPLQQWNDVTCTVKNASLILEAYEQEKKKNVGQLLLDFDDMLTYAEQFLREDMQLRTQFQARFDYVLSDESQDTSLVQHQIIAWLVEKHQNLFVVADDDQSIYSWRGAEPSYLLEFKKYYPTAKILYMEQNYRSSKNIVTIANQFIKRNKNRYAKEMFTKNEVSKPIVIQQHEQVFEEISHIVSQIKQESQLSEIAILYRNHQSSLLLIHELSRHSIPFYMKDADDRFFKHWVVDDILNIMRLSYNDRIFELFEKVVPKLNIYVSRAQLVELKQHHVNESLFELMFTKLTLPSYQIIKIKEVQEQIQSLKQITPTEALERIRQVLGYDKTITDIADKYGFQKEYLTNILNSLQMIAEPLQTLPQFAERLKSLEQIQKEAKRNRGNDAVTLSTLHSAKGLEFNTVHMLDLVQHVIPSRSDYGQTELVEEATRLFYVGMTRARHELTLHYVKKWQGVHVQPSIFVEDVKRLIEPRKNKPQVQSVQVTVRANETGSIVQDEWLLSGELLTSRSLLAKGMAVEHKQFGHGIITDILDNKMKIEFDEVGTKTVMVDYIINQALLKRSEVTTKSM